MFKYLVILFFATIGNVNAMTIDPIKSLTDDPTCLKLNMYHEARGEKMKGMIEVMKVTIARLQDRRFPNTICDVVWQQFPVEQFSWTKDNISDNYISDIKTWNQIDKIVSLWYEGTMNLNINPDILYYHTGPVTPFFKKLKFSYTVGNHRFYKEKKK